MNLEELDLEELQDMNAGDEEEESYYLDEDWPEDEERKVRKKGLWKKLLLFCCILILGIAGGALYYVKTQTVYAKAITEAGTPVEAKDFFKGRSGVLGELLQIPEEGDFTEDTVLPDCKVPGIYPLKLKAGLFTFQTKLEIQDTIPPVAEGCQVVVSKGEEREAEDFICNLQDCTDVTVVFAEKPDFSAYGHWEVPLILTDLGGNTANVMGELVVSKTLPIVTVEAGEAFPALEAFLAAELTSDQKKSAKLVSPVSSFDLNKVAEYEVALMVEGESYTSVLKVVDTTAPTGSVQDVDSFYTADLTADAFVIESQDLFPVTAAFEKEPDMSLPGPQTVSIILSDPSGNQTILSASLTLSEDLEAPELIGVKNFVYFIGDGISYKQDIVVNDNANSNLELKIDHSAVDTEKEGTYPITYSVTDKAGNSTSQTIYVDVRVQQYSQEEVDAMADAVLEKICPQESSDYEKCLAIFKWVKSNVGYIDSSQKENWLQGAYEGLKNHTGDCYVYAMTSKELLQRAGITTMDIKKIPRKHDHFWNLVDLGTGWLHFDTTPRISDHPDIFLWTDEELMQYSDKHSGSHNYDKKAYPEIAGEDPDGDAYGYSEEQLAANRAARARALANAQAAGQEEAGMPEVTDGGMGVIAP